MATPIILSPILEVNEAAHGDIRDHDVQSAGINLERVFDNVSPPEEPLGDQCILTNNNNNMHVVESLGHPSGPNADNVVIRLSPNYDNEVEEYGPNLEALRPSYITLRPNRKNIINNKKKDKVREFITPDLNNSAEEDINSDPFDIESIFRMEEEAKRVMADNELSDNSGDGADVFRDDVLRRSGEETEVNGTIKVGVALGIEEDFFLQNHRFLLVSGKISGVEEKVNILNIHAPDEARLRKVLWEDLLVLINQMEGMWVIFGDFNDVRSEDERVNSRFDRGSFDVFNEFIMRASLFEFSMTGGKYTFISGYADVKLSKLDRFLVSDSFVNRWPTAKAGVLERGASDHCPISLICNPLDFGPIPFKFFNSWINDQNLTVIVQKALNSPHIDGRKDLSFMSLLKRIKVEVKKWRRDVRSAENQERKLLSETDMGSRCKWSKNE
ncbi:putative Endonuclease/exonuclease/phosphatase superfamily [Helianthus annuus]|uniref:Endonuclease/exonuclease/phosphatase superfamily n=3 Tax=Helianthus annuus TaxID=4232 RepID=A0A9K3E5A2_HELAN|nr:putative Endonuclease/exonuclease/phosphatase superfamily [Helianthus annuus]